MTPSVEMDHDPFGLDFHLAGGLDEFAKDLLGGRTVEPLQVVCQPAIAPIGQDRHCHVQIDIQPHLAGQAIEMKEVDARPQPILHAVAAGIPDDQRSGRLAQLVGEEECGPVASQPIHGQLSDQALVTGELDLLIDVAHVLVTTLGRIDHGPTPGGRRQGAESADHRRAALADRHEVDATAADPGQLRIRDDLAVEVQPSGILAGDGVPEFDKTHHLARLIGADQVGVGRAQDATLLLLGEETRDARPGLASHRQVVGVQGRGIAAERDGVEVRGEVVPLGEEERSQRLDPAREQAELMVAAGAIGVLGGE
jgi:hypothetical protein